MNINKLFITIFSISILSLSIFSTSPDQIHQTANKKNFIVDNSDAKLSIIKEIVFDERGKITDRLSRDARWKNFRIQAAVSYGDAEAIIVYVERRSDPRIRSFFRKENLGAKEKKFLEQEETQRIFPPDTSFKSMSVIKDHLFILTTSGLWKVKISADTGSKIEGQMRTTNAWANVTDLIAVGKYLVFHQNDGLLFSIDTEKPVTDATPQQIGKKWGPTSKLIAVNDINFLVHSPAFENLQLKRADKSAVKNTGIAHASITENEGVPYQGAFLIRNGEAISLVRPSQTVVNVDPRPRAKDTAPRFKYKTLKDWTDHALRDWDENYTRVPRTREFASSTPDMKMGRDEYLLALKHYVTQSSSATKNQANWFRDEEPNAEFFDVSQFGQGQEYNDIDYFAQRITVPPGSKIVVMGDFHGSLHSLLRNLWRLQESGYLSNGWKIIPDNVFLFFTGDYLDRGRFSTEVLYTLLRLKLANFDRVVLIRGNHEDQDTATEYGFRDEVLAKFCEEDGRRIFSDTLSSVRFMPTVVFTMTEAGGEKQVLHFSHGGFSYDLSGHYNYLPAGFIGAPNQNVRFDLMSRDQHLGHSWSDFQQINNSRNSSRGAGLVIGQTLLREYLNINKIRAIFRGHQDQEFGVKMFFDDPLDRRIAEAANNTIQYKGGPYHWSDVVPADRITEARTVGIRLKDYYPVITFTTASEGRIMKYDAYGVIKTAENWDDFRLEIHESKANIEDRNYFVTIDKAKAPEDDGISVGWSEDGPGRCLLDPK